MAHAGQGVLKDVFRIPFLVAHLGETGKGGHLRDQALKDVGVIQQPHEAIHGFGRHLAPFVHDVRGGHIVQHAGGGPHNGQPGIGLNGQVKVGRKAQGAHGQQVIVTQRFVRQARKADGPALEVGKAFVGVARAFRAAKARKPQVEFFLLAHAVDHGGGNAQQGKLRVPGGGHLQRIKTVGDAVLLHDGQGALFPFGHGRGEEAHQRIQIRFTGDIHGRDPTLAQQMLLQGGVDHMRVIAVAQKGFANGYGVFEGLVHGNLLAKMETCVPYYARRRA